MLRDGWYRAADVDRLSEEEAALIAARIIRRFTANVVLDPVEKTRLELSIAEACKRYLISEPPGTAQGRQEGLRNAILDAGRTYLTADNYNALQNAVVAGHRPLPNER